MTNIETMTIGGHEIQVEFPLGQNLKPSGKDLSKQLDTMLPVIQATKEKIDSLGGNKPSEVTLEFSLTLGAEAGVIATKASVEASFTITVTWSL